MSDIDTWTNTPIPIPVFPSDSDRRRNVRISDDTERLVDVADYSLSGENVYYASDIPPYFHRAPGAIPRILVRRTVAEKLARVDGLLKGFWYEMFLLDGYRPLEVQAYFFNEWVPDYLRRSRPDASPEWISEEVGNYWAKPFPSWSDELLLAPPPHSTWWAVDLLLRRIRDGARLEMGTIFDDITDRSHLRHFETVREEDMWFTEREAKKNRRILYWAMISQGFAPHPKEWWHFSYGDQAWAYFQDRPEARYWFAEEIFASFFQTGDVE